LTTPAEIAVERRGGVVVARVGGEVDMTNATYVRDELLRSIPNDALGLVVDLGDCRYLDSAAIEVLFDLARRLGRRRQDLRLAVPPSSPLRRVLILTEISSAAPMHDGLDEAVTAVG
jgi:anti-anti-sigma factor